MNTDAKTLTQLEGDDWGPPPIEAPPSIRRCYELRNKPIQDMDIEDLRLLIGQDIGLSHLMPLAIGILEKDPIVRGEDYFGDLLASVLRASHEYYQSNPDIKKRVGKIMETLPKAMDCLDYIDYDCTNEAISEAFELFNSGQ